MSLTDHPYASFLHRVAKPARYAGGEYNQVVKDPASVRVRMALGFPDVYDIGMSHLGTKILYKLINDQPDLVAERVFCPWVDMEAELRERALPLLTLETASRLTDFDVVGFSLQYELTYTNILTMLDLAGIPLRAEDRDESHPLIVGGGPNATHPEPVAPFFDAFLIGDAEEALPPMLRLVGEMRDRGASRRDTLVAIAELGGFYCPALYDTAIDERTGYLVVGEPTDERVPARVVRQILDDLSRYPFPDDAPVAAAEAIFDRMSIEIARGCTEGCRFCQAGMIYRPVRERDPDEIVDTIVSAIRKGGYDEAGLTTLSTADYSCISPLIKKVMEKLRPEKTSLSVASLRAYGLDEDLLDEIRSVRATGLTFAPEAGTQRMRDVVNKNISEEDLERTAHRVFQRGWRRMKLYFMIGLPTEEDEDVIGIMETGARMKRIGARYHNRGAVGVTVSVSSHVPKPHTPFQWCALDTIDEMKRKQGLLREHAHRHRLEFRKHDPRTSYLECILGRGDRRVADVIEEVWRRGARFDSWDDQMKWEAWMGAVQAFPGIPYDLYLGTLPLDAKLPWDHLDMQLTDRFLATEYKRTLKNKLSPPCGKPVGAQVHHTNAEDHEADQRILVCYHCGVACDMTRMREERGEFLTRLGALTPPRPTERVEVETAEIDAPAPATGSRAKGNGKVRRGTPAHDFAQGDKHRYRIRFAKRGVMALTGHLDLVRAMPRVLRRAGLNPYYSEGYHPKPLMEFSPPLPLGAVGLDELVDLALAERREAPEVLSRLLDVAPQGLDFQDVLALPADARKLSRLLSAAEYVVRIGAPALGGVADLDAAPERFLSRTESPARVLRKRKEKTVDLRPAVDSVTWIESAEAPDDLGREPGSRFLRMRLRLDGESHARPEEVASALLGADAGVEPIHIARVRFLSWADGAWQPVIPEPTIAI